MKAGTILADRMTSKVRKLIKPNSRAQVDGVLGLPIGLFFHKRIKVYAPGTKTFKGTKLSR
jgi:hypothetical protein